MRRRAWIAVAVALVALSSPLGAQSIEESFEPAAGWSWGVPTTVVQSGGDPAAYLESALLDTPLPVLRTQSGVQSPFVGDYRAAGVRGVAVSLQIGAVMTHQGRELSVVLRNDGGTPGNVNDDCSAYFVGPDNIPTPGSGWQTYQFRVPADREVLPAGWALFSVAGNSCPGLTVDEAWNLVIADVDVLEFTYGDPTFFYIFQQWTGLGLDNPTIWVSE